MAFITVGGSVTSYAEYSDLLQKDQRLFEENEITIPAESGFATTIDFLESILERATARINLKIKTSAWWLGYNQYNGTSVSNPALVPDFDPNKIRSRKDEFTDMCVYYALKEFILPLVADFSTEESSEVQKIKYYEVKFNELYSTVLATADFYDFDGNGTVDSSEKVYSYTSSRRTRSRRNMAKVR